MCGDKMPQRKGKVVCSTTCRVNKKKAWDEYDKLYNHFIKLSIGRSEYETDSKWKRSIVEAIVENEKKLGSGNVAKEWQRKKHSRKFVQLDIDLEK